jgi:hypothetical protein
MLSLFYGFFLLFVAGRDSVVFPNQTINVPPNESVTLPLTIPAKKGLLSIRAENQQNFGIRLGLKSAKDLSATQETTGFAASHTVFWKVGPELNWLVVVDNAMEGRAAAVVRVSASFESNLEVGPVQNPAPERVRALAATVAIVLIVAVWIGTKLS